MTQDMKLSLGALGAVAFIWLIAAAPELLYIGFVFTVVGGLAYILHELIENG